MQKITEMIDALVAEKTFSLEGVKAIDAVRSKAEGLQSELERTQETLTKMTKDRDEGRAQAKANADICVQWKAREDLITARERTMTLKEQEAAVANATANTFRECFALVFRNATISETVMRNGSTAVSGGPGMYPTSLPTSENETRTKTQI